MKAWILTAAMTYLGSVGWSEDIQVDPDGPYKTVQAAIDAAASHSEQPIQILIKAGKYSQRLTIGKDKTNLHLVGQGKRPEDTVLTAAAKAGDPKPDGKGNIGTSGSASVYFNADNCCAENLTFENSAGHGAGQAVAVKTTGDRLKFNKCRFLGAQDTLYLTNGRAYLKDCYISGDVDFIFGNADAVFDHCTINSSDVGYIAAPNTKPDSEFGFLFLNCTLTAADNVKPGTIFLGRPWQWDHQKPEAIYLHTTMGPQISPAGWNPWDAKANTSPGDHARFEEFDSKTPAGKAVDLSKRVDWEKQLSKVEAEKLTVSKVLAGSDGWDPTAR